MQYEKPNKKSSTDPFLGLSNSAVFRHNTPFPDLTNYLQSIHLSRRAPLTSTRLNKSATRLSVMDSRMRALPESFCSINSSVTSCSMALLTGLTHVRQRVQCNCCKESSSHLVALALAGHRAPDAGRLEQTPDQHHSDCHQGQVRQRATAARAVHQGCQA